MSCYYGLNNFNNTTAFKAGQTTSLAPLAKPIETVQTTIEEVTDTFVKADTEEKKKSKKAAIAAGSSVLVISALVALLNPRYSSKLIGRLKTLHHKTQAKVKTNRGDKLKENFYKISHNFIDGTLKVANFTNNINSAKDLGFKWLCAEPRTYSGMENKKTGKILRNINAGIAKVLKKPYNTITTWFDKIGQFTVRKNYHRAAKEMDSLETLMKDLSSKLPAGQKAEFETKLKEVSQLREYFSEQNLAKRFIEQENMMSNLEEDFVKKCIKYKRGYRNRFKKRSEHMWNNMTFWAQDILQPKREIVEKQGQEAVEKLTGKIGGEKGIYNELYDMLKPYLSPEENLNIEKMLKKSSKKLRSANQDECVNYFDKKRDLILGSAPTDILTAIIGLAGSGIAISTAKTKEERTSTAVAGAFPVVAGLGASMAFTAMLVSGVKSMMLGALTSVILSIGGSLADKYILGNNPKKQQEVINA